MTRWQAFRCSHRATKRPNPERGRRARMRWIAVLALLPAAATAASWSIREAPDAASPLPQARVIADSGDEVIVFRTNDSVHLQLTIGGAFTTLSPQWGDDERPLEFEDVNAQPDEEFQRRHLREAVAQSVAKLPAHHRDVFVLRELEGRSYEEIAEITHCNLGTVKSRLNRARNAFAEIIEPSLR